MRRLLALLSLSSACASLQAQTIGPDFAGSYSAVSLGSVPSLPTNYGGLTFLDDNTLLIGGAANGASGSLYTVGLTRGADGFITGFSGPAQRFGGPTGAVGEYNDGGVVFGPGGVLFTARWPINGLGQTKPGSIDEDKIIDLTPLGVASSLSALNFVPAGFGGAGQIKLVSYVGGQFYSASLAPDGMGTYDLAGLVAVDVDPSSPGIQNLPGGPEGFVYITAGNPGFAGNGMLLSEYAAGKVVAYELDANGNPLLATRRVFVDGLTGAEGAAIDPVTGDFLFSTFGGSSQVLRVTGFATPIPEPSSWVLMALGLAGLSAAARARRPG
jgi:hypothetical protein